MRIGIGVGSFGGGDAGVDAQIEQTIIAEADGFESVWFTHSRGADSLITLSLAGQATSAIELITGVIPVYSREPLLMAQQALTAQHIVGGRLTLGLGLAHPEFVPKVWNHSYDHPAQFMEEYLSVLLPLLNKGAVEFEGNMISTNASLEMTGIEPPSVVLAALGPRMLKLAAESTDGTFLWATGPRTIESHIAPKLAATAHKPGGSAARIIAAIPICVTDHPGEAREAIAKKFSRYAYMVNYRRVLDIEGVDGLDGIAVIGNEDQAEQQIRRISASGATDFFAAPVPLERNDDLSLRRTRSFLASLVGKI